MAGFWSGFGKGWSEGLDRNARRKEFEETLSERRKERILDLYGTTQKRRTEVQSEAIKYENSVEALRDRLKDEKGNLVDGAEKFLEDPVLAHQVLTKINSIEEQAAADDNAYTPLLYGENIVENFSVYSSGGQQVVTPDIDSDAIITKVLSDEPLSQEEYTTMSTQLYGSTPTSTALPEPVVQVDTEIMRRPSDKTFEPGREVFKAQIMDMLTQDMAALEGLPDDEAQNEYAELRQLSEALSKEGALSDQAMIKLHDMYGAEAFARLKRLEKTSPTIQRVDEDPLLERSMRAYYIPLLKQRVDNPNLSEEDRNQARQYLKQRFGVSY